MISFKLSLTRITLFVFAWAVSARSAQPDRTEFFETKIRPLLTARCSSCHGEKVQMGGIRLTSKEGLHVAGVVFPGDPPASRLLQAIRHTGKVKMPPDGKLADREIEAVERWIADG